MLQNYAVIIQGANLRNSELTGNGDALILKQSHIKYNGELVLSSNEIFTEINEQNQRYLIQEGDIIMATTGSLSIIGNMFQYNLPMKAIASSHLTIIRPNVNHYELYNKLRERYYHIKTMATQGAYMNKVYTRQIRELEI